MIKTHLKIHSLFGTYASSRSGTVLGRLKERTEKHADLANIRHKVILNPETQGI